MQEIHELLMLSRKNIHKCPWCKEKTPENYFTLLKEEITELEIAFKNNDLENVKEEIGDVLWDTISLLYVCERDKNVKPNEVLLAVLKKFKTRKPWLLTDQAVTQEEASRIWQEAKKKEKGK